MSRFPKITHFSSLSTELLDQLTESRMAWLLLKNSSHVHFILKIVSLRKNRCRYNTFERSNVLLFHVNGEPSSLAWQVIPLQVRTSGGKAKTILKNELWISLRSWKGTGLTLSSTVHHRTGSFSPKNNDEQMLLLTYLTPKITWVWPYIKGIRLFNTVHLNIRGACQIKRFLFYYISSPRCSS